MKKIIDTIKAIIMIMAILGSILMGIAQGKICEKIIDGEPLTVEEIIIFMDR